MMKKIEVTESMGMRMRYEAGANFTIFDVGLHYHSAPIERSRIDERDMCDFRAGFYFTLFNLGFLFGKFWTFNHDHESK